MASQNKEKKFTPPTAKFDPVKEEVSEELLTPDPPATDPPETEKEEKPELIDAETFATSRFSGDKVKYTAIALKQSFPEKNPQKTVQQWEEVFNKLFNTGA